MPLLEARGVSGGYPGRGVLHGVDLSVAAGEIVGLIGPNGAGKSTLLAVLTRLVTPTEGAVFVEGAPLATYPPRALARRVGVVPQAPPRPDGYRVGEVVAMGRTPYLRLWRGLGESDHRAIDAAMDLTRIRSLAARRVEELSTGEWQRVLLARALAQGPRLLLLDEPTSHVDLRFQQEVARTIRDSARAGLGVLWVIHDLNVAARHCHRLVLLHQGRVAAAGTPEEVLTRPLLERVYEADLEVSPSRDGPVVRLLP